RVNLIRSSLLQLNQVVSQKQRHSRIGLLHLDRGQRRDGGLRHATHLGRPHDVAEVHARIAVTGERTAPDATDPTFACSPSRATFRKTRGPGTLDAIARDCRFVQRHRVVTACSVFWALMVTLVAQPTRYISDVLRSLNAQQGWSIRYTPFWDRLVGN